ncbi:MAG: GntR family transcriptional regulator [Actinophytocola sp.]|uniref:substrate-binding domain-containing protein n=1 Tax=Actinophytocola sp. TaxID=1872138 RepID=UPI001328382A|nr:substrate-binding domain-containing protein [Actinophytocola sp.]MPZ81904.1 GntR family transcriptional regulator [Actinophytocola sp.]
MTRYLELSTHIARAVLAGELAPGAELASVRDLAHARATTVATASRAYRHLAEHAVIHLEPRRRARVASDGPVAAQRLLGGESVFRLAGSDDPALDLLLRHIGDPVAVVATRGSLHGLAAVATGSADGATVHLRHHSGVFNAPFARAVLRGRRPALVHLWRREQGLLLPSGNPRGITDVRQLRGLRIAKRGSGTGTRVLLDHALTDAGLEPDDLAGPELGSHLEVALAVAAGAVHAGLAVRGAAADLDLDFLPLVREDFDLVLSADTLGAAAPIIEAVHDSSVRDAIAKLGGYDLSRAGVVDQLI